MGLKAAVGDVISDFRGGKEGHELTFHGSLGSGTVVRHGKKWKIRRREAERQVVKMRSNRSKMIGVDRLSSRMFRCL